MAIDHDLTAEQREIVDQTQRFREEELLPLEERFLQDGRRDPALTTALEERARIRGLWALEVPRELGGRQLDETTMCLVSEELYKDPSMFEFGGSPEPCLYLGTQEQREHYLLPMIAGMG